MVTVTGSIATFVHTAASGRPRPAVGAPADPAAGAAAPAPGSEAAVTAAFCSSRVGCSATYAAADTVNSSVTGSAGTRNVKPCAGGTSRSPYV